MEAELLPHSTGLMSALLWSQNNFFKIALRDLSLHGGKEGGVGFSAMCTLVRSSSETVTLPPAQAMNLETHIYCWHMRGIAWAGNVLLSQKISHRYGRQLSLIA